jgi:protein ImuB
LGFHSDFGFRVSDLKTGVAEATPAAPLVLVRTVASRQLVLFACEKARAAGVDPGMTLAEASALCSGLTYQEHEPDKDQKALHQLARWMVRFSPVVSLEPPDALFVDITGSERLFHGLDRLVSLIDQALTRLGLHFQLAVAETPGMAWALTEGKRSTTEGKRSTFNAHRSTFKDKDERPTSNVQRPTSNEIQSDYPLSLGRWTLNVERWTFAQLPIQALRLDPALLPTFHNLGIHTIGQLMQLPRETLPARFGQTVLHRLDQALGKIPEPLVPIAHTQPIRAKIEFEGGLESLTDLWQACKHLLEQIVTELRQRSCGARQLVAEFLQQGQPPIVKTISLTRPAANLATLWNLLRCASETVRCGQDGFSGLKLSVPKFDRLTADQLHLLDQESQRAAEELDHLIERLRVRLGEKVVLFPEMREAHLPELAVCYGAGEEGKRSTFNAQRSTFKDKCERPTSNVQLPTSNGMHSDSHLSLGRWTLNVERWTFAPSLALIPDEPDTEKPRPLHLLPTPVEIHCTLLDGDLDQRQPISFTLANEAHPLVHCNGPERITGSWWEGRNKTRDYFEVEDRGGSRFWIFRVEETRKWYLHGLHES